MIDSSHGHNNLHSGMPESQVSVSKVQSQEVKTHKVYAVRILRGFLFYLFFSLFQFIFVFLFLGQRVSEET